MARNKGVVLLRLHEKYNIWTGPGGHIDPGEDSNEAERLRSEVHRYASMALKLASF